MDGQEADGEKKKKKARFRDSCGYSKMQGTSFMRPGKAVQGRREGKKGGQVVSLDDLITGNLPSAL